MSWTSTIEDMVDRLNSDLHLLDRDIKRLSPEAVDEAKRLHKECTRMLSKMQAVRTAMGDPLVDPAARVLELELMLDQRNADNEKLATDLARERELRQRAERECAEARKKATAANGLEVKYGKSSGLVRSLQERIDDLQRQNKLLRKRVFDKASARNVRKGQKAKARIQATAPTQRKMKADEIAAIVVEKKSGRSSRTKSP